MVRFSVQRAWGFAERVRTEPDLNKRPVWAPPTACLSSFLISLCLPTSPTCSSHPSVPMAPWTPSFNIVAPSLNHFFSTIFNSSRLDSSSVCLGLGPLLYPATSSCACGPSSAYSFPRLTVSPFFSALRRPTRPAQPPTRADLTRRSVLVGSVAVPHYPFLHPCLHLWPRHRQIIK